MRAGGRRLPYHPRMKMMTLYTIEFGSLFCFAFISIHLKQVCVKEFMGNGDGEDIIYLGYCALVIFHLRSHHLKETSDSNGRHPSAIRFVLRETFMDVIKLCETSYATGTGSILIVYSHL